MTQSQSYPKDYPEIDLLFKQTGNIAEVSRMTGASFSFIKAYLFNRYKTASLSELKLITGVISCSLPKKGIGKKSYNQCQSVLAEKIEELLQKRGSLSTVADESGLSILQIKKYLELKFKTKSIIKIREILNNQNNAYDNIEPILKQSGSLPLRVKQAGLDIYKFKKYLRHKYSTDSVIKVKKILGIQSDKRELSEATKNKIIRAERLYREYGSLRQLSIALKMTREGVRQLLVKGQRHGLIVYNFQNKPDQVPRGTLE